MRHIVQDLCGAINLGGSGKMPDSWGNAHTIILFDWGEHWLWGWDSGYGSWAVDGRQVCRALRMRRYYAVRNLRSVLPYQA